MMLTAEVSAATRSPMSGGICGSADDAFPLPHGRGDEFHHGSPENDPRSLPPKGLPTPDIYVPDHHIESIKVWTRDFR